PTRNFLRSSAGSARADPHRSSVASKRAGFPPPVPTEAGSMPTYESLGTDDRDGLENRWKPSIQHDQEQAIPIRELDATPHPPLQHNQLMSERRVLCHKSG